MLLSLRAILPREPDSFPDLRGYKPIREPDLIEMLHPTILVGYLLLVTSCVLAGFGPPPPKDQLYQTLYGKPCDCLDSSTPHLSSSDRSLSTVDCGTQTAHLVNSRSSIGGSQGKPKWLCITKPTHIPTVNGRPGPCPAACNKSTYQIIHSSCYENSQSCLLGDFPYFTAITTRSWTGSFGGESDLSYSTGVLKIGQAGCGSAKIGTAVCWPQTPPIHLSDGGGPSDQIKQRQVRQRLEVLAAAQNTFLSHHPLIRQKHKPTDLDHNTMSLMESTLKTLNITNPALAKDCWLCMALGKPIPLALPANLSQPLYNSSNCSITPPFYTQPMGYTYSYCLFSNITSPPTNALDVGFFPLNCTAIVNSTAPACPAPNHVFICGNGLAFTALPTNWTGLCALAFLLPDIDILPGDQSLPIPALDLFPGRQKRALAFIPLMAGLGITTAMATGAAGVGVSVNTYHQLSLQLIDGGTTLSDTINDLQDQVDSLTEVVLQNRQGLDLLTAEQGGVCLALQERCCFYANKSGIVRDKVKKLQEDLLQRKKQLLDNPFLTSFHGLLPVLLPILGPILGLLLLVSLGPWTFNKLTGFIKQQIDNILAKPIHIHYHRLAMTDTKEQGLPTPGPRYIDI